ncbi:coiled-coil domain-containing protein, partial [[Mycoplasma] testudinis]|uniref:coiled-coil domain-containing protein n=1 Tax=[Mycoplasma] testudinis TaxID=33924 RepID=UPI0004871C9D
LINNIQDIGKDGWTINKLGQALSWVAKNVVETKNELKETNNKLNDTNNKLNETNNKLNETKSELKNDLKREISKLYTLIKKYHPDETPIPPPDEPIITYTGNEVRYYNIFRNESNAWFEQLAKLYGMHRSQNKSKAYVFKIWKTDFNAVTKKLESLGIKPDAIVHFVKN